MVCCYKLYQILLRGLRNQLSRHAKPSYDDSVALANSREPPARSSTGRGRRPRMAVAGECRGRATRMVAIARGMKGWPYV